MHLDLDDDYRSLLDQDPPLFIDRVNTPWETIPDFPEFNRAPYRRILRSLKSLQVGRSPASQGILILGEAGTGKTHLLMRAAKELAGENQILFVRKPNNEEAVAKHIWSQIIQSLDQTLVSKDGKPRKQIDDLLAHVFSAVLIPEFRKDIEEGKRADRKRIWLRHLERDPYRLFTMLGSGETRQKNLNELRRRTLNFLRMNHPEVDRNIARALITYCFVEQDNNKRVLLTWLAGEEIEEAEATSLGLTRNWVEVDDDSTESSVRQQREEMALRALASIGILSTYYHPLILAFDQLEGLRDEERLTRKWGDAVREIFTMTPNLVVVTCVFPSLWKTWFTEVLDGSTTQRIAQSEVLLEPLTVQHARHILASQLRDSFVKHRLPTNIYPFEENDIGDLCHEKTTVRKLIQDGKRLFEAWLDEQDIDGVKRELFDTVVTHDGCMDLLRQKTNEFFNESMHSYGTGIPQEEDLFGRLREVLRNVLISEPVFWERADCYNRVMPSNLIIQANGRSACVAAMNSVANSFTARMRNLMTVMTHGEQFSSALLVRDRRCRQPGPRGQDYLESFLRAGGRLVELDPVEYSSLASLYDTLIAVQERAVVMGNHEIGRDQYISHFRESRQATESQVFSQLKSIAPWVGALLFPETQVPVPSARDRESDAPRRARTASPLALRDAPTVGVVAEPSPIQEEDDGSLDLPEDIGILEGRRTYPREVDAGQTESAEDDLGGEGAEDEITGVYVTTDGASARDEDMSSSTVSSGVTEGAADQSLEDSKPDTATSLEEQIFGVLEEIDLPLRAAKIASILSRLSGSRVTKKSVNSVLCRNLDKGKLRVDAEHGWSLMDPGPRTRPEDPDDEEIDDEDEYRSEETGEEEAWDEEELDADGDHVDGAWDEEEHQTEEANTKLGAEPASPEATPDDHARPNRETVVTARPEVAVVIGDESIEAARLGVFGKLRADGRKLGLALTSPQCIVFLGYMGSGKSYALGVLVENALQSIPNISVQTKPLSVVAFNYRRNPDSRFEYVGYSRPNENTEEVEKLRTLYGGSPVALSTVRVFGYANELLIRRNEYGGLPTFPILFRPDELRSDHWQILMKPPSAQAEYMDVVRDIIQKLYYEERLSLTNLASEIQGTERLSDSQRRRAENRLIFARKFVSDRRNYEWEDVLTPGSMNIFDLRMQAMTSSDALRLCLVLTDLMRRTKNNVNKMVIFDEAHEYVNSKELVDELDNAITQIRHDGLSFVLASQFPEKIPETLFKHLLTRFIFKLPSRKALQYLKKAAHNLSTLSESQMSNLELEKGVCFVQSDDRKSDSTLRYPQELDVRPRCTMHGGQTIRNV